MLTVQYMNQYTIWTAKHSRSQMKLTILWIRRNMFSVITWIGLKSFQFAPALINCDNVKKWRWNERKVKQYPHFTNINAIEFLKVKIKQWSLIYSSNIKRIRISCYYCCYSCQHLQYVKFELFFFKFLKYTITHSTLSKYIAWCMFQESVPSQIFDYRLTLTDM